MQAEQPVVEVTPAVASSGSRMLTRPSGHQGKVAFLYLLPVIISALIFTIGPFIYTFYISFTNYNLLYHPIDYTWTGLRNYERIFDTGGAFLPVLRWTSIFMVITTILNVGGGMILAMMLNHPGLKERNVYRTLLIIPWALPGILLIQVWAGMYNVQGPINLVLGKVGVEPIRWLGEGQNARAALLIANLWFSFPFFMTVGLAALQSIPRDLYEVADLDGAGSWARMRDITLPFLLVAITPLLLTQLAFQFNNAGIIILLTNGGPQVRPGASYGFTDTLGTIAYNLFYKDRDMGLAAAYGVVIFVILAVFIVLSSMTTRSFKEDD